MKKCIDITATSLKPKNENYLRIWGTTETEMASFMLAVFIKCPTIAPYLGYHYSNT